jgi:hypothetical protein
MNVRDAAHFAKLSGKKSPAERHTCGDQTGWSLTYSLIFDQNSSK